MTVPESTILAEIRKTHAQLKKASDEGQGGWTMRLTVEEMDTLLAIVDERDELRRQTVGDWEPDFPPVRVETVRADELGPFVLGSVSDHLAALNDAAHALAEAQDIPPHLVVEGCPRRGTIHDCPLGGCPTPVRDLGREQRETPPTVMHIAGRGGVLCGAEHVSHVTDGRRFADCPACIEVYEARRCDAICDGDGGRSSCFTPWCRCTVCHGQSA